MFNRAEVQSAEGCLCADAAARFYQQDPKLCRTLKRCQDLADSLYQRRPVHQTERHIRADFLGNVDQFLIRKIQMKQAVDDADRCSRIRAASRKTRLGRNMFQQCAGKVLIKAAPLLHDMDCLDYGVLVIDRKIGAVQGHRCLRCRHKIHHIIEIHRNHDHPQIMIAVFSAPDDIQAEIDFRIGSFSHYPFLFRYASYNA